MFLVKTGIFERLGAAATNARAGLAMARASFKLTFPGDHLDVRVVFLDTGYYTTLRRLLVFAVSVAESDVFQARECAAPATRTCTEVSARPGCCPVPLVAGTPRTQPHAHSSAPTGPNANPAVETLRSRVRFSNSIVFPSGMPIVWNKK